MINKTLRRLAVGASAITVAGVLVPLAAATTASAAEATAITATPQSQIVTAGTQAQYTASLTATTANPTPTSTNGVDYAVTAGPSHVSLTGTKCDDNGAGSNTGSGPFKCDVLTTGFAAGSYTITIFDDVAGTGTFQNGDPSTTVSLTIAGAVNSVTISPAGGSEAQGVYQAYTVTAKDSAGTPVPGAAVSLTITQSNATTSNLFIGFNSTGKRNTSFVGTAAPTAGGNGSRTANTTTADGTGAQAVGTATFNAASQVTGTLNLTAFQTGTPATSSNTTLTIDPGTANDVTSVVLTPPSANAFTGKTVTETATLKNTQGDLVGGVTPSGFVTGANTGAAVTPSGATDGTGTATLSYTATNAGTDTLTGFVNQTGHAVNTGGLDSGEPSGTATVTVAAEPNGTTLSDPYGGPNGTDTVPTTSGTTNVTFTLTATSGPLSGYTVNFSTPTSAKYSLGSTSGTTNAQGQVTVAVTNANPADGDSVAVTATLQGDSTKTDTVTVDYSAPATDEVIIEPYAGVSPVGGTSATFKATLYDQFGTAQTTGVTYSWVVSGRNNTTNNVGATGTGQTFSYTDVGPTSSGGFDDVSVTATLNGNSTSDDVQQEFVIGTAKAAQANIDLGSANGDYVANGPGGTAPFVANGFTKSDTVGVSKDYTPANVNLEEVNVALIDANGNPLEGKSVSFSSTGVGQFFTYNPQTGDYDVASGNSATALVDACDGSNGDPDNNCDYATVYVASNQTGTQKITATVDGITDTATVTYAGNYVPVTPERLIDTRTGQGDVAAWNSGSSSKGGLNPNSVYYFDLSSTDAPLGADAYVFNVTAIGPSNVGNLRIAPAGNCGGGGVVPSTSLINYQPGKDVANSIVVPNTSGCGNDEFVLYSAGASVNVAIDLQGYYPDTNNSEFEGITPPTRVADTRNSGGTVAANTSRSFPIAGTAGIPVGARAVALNVTAIGPNGLGNLRVYPDGASVPTTSNINYIPGVDKAAFVVVNLPANGKIDVYSAGSPVNVAIDAFGYYPTGSTVVTQAPVRVFDSRSGVELKSGVPVDLPVTTPGATNGVPADAEAVLVSLTAIHAADSTGVGNLRAYPAGQSTPTVSNINYVSKTTDVANFAIVPVGANGKITLYSAGSNINAAVDILGYVPAGS